MTRSLSHCFISGQLLEMKDAQCSSGTTGFTSPVSLGAAQSQAFLLGIPVPGENPFSISSGKSLGRSRVCIQQSSPCSARAGSSSDPWPGVGCASSRALHHPVVPCRVRAGVQAQIPGQEQGLNPVLHCPKPMKEVMKFFTCPHFAALGTNTDLCLILHNILLFHSVPFAGGWLLCCVCQGSDKQRRQTRGLGSIGGGGGWRQRRALNVSCLCHGMDSICLGLSWENCRSPAQNFTLRAS